MADGLPLHEPVTLDALAEHPERARHLPPDATLALLARAEGLAAVLRAAAGARTKADENQIPAAPDRMLTAEDVATIFGRSVDWVYRQAKRNLAWVVFTRREGPRTLRFDREALDHYRARRRRGG